MMPPYAWLAGRVLCPLLATSLAATAAMASRQPSALHAATTLVELSAIVSSDGQPVTDLQASEVAVLDNGVPQPLVAVEYVDTITGDALESPGEVVLVLDDLGTAPDDTRAAITVGLALVEALGPQDRLAIVNTGPFPLIQQLSTDRTAARHVVRQFLGQRGRSAMSLAPAQACRQAAVTLGVIENAIKALPQQPGHRRALLVVSDGQRLYWGDSRKERCSQARGTFARILAASATTNVPIYGVDVRGAQEGDVPRTGTLPGRLHTLAMVTGGTLSAARDDVASGVHQLVRDSRQYYRIAYAQPVVPRRDRDTPRRIEVQVRRGGVEVRARQQYLPR